MSKCIRCNVKINDETELCPLCHQVLESDNGVQMDKYPDARIVTRRFRLFENIVLFLSIVAIFVVFVIDYLMSGHLEWSLIVFLAVVYGNVVLRLSILGKTGYMFKTVWSIISALCFLGLIDYMTGYKGWSANYVFPSAIIGSCVGVLVLMIVNNRNWQSYMMFQIFQMLLSVSGMIMWGMGIITFPLLTLIALGCSVLLFLGTLIIGDQRARTELKRRFYV